MSNQVWKSFAAQEVSHSVAHYLTTIYDLHAVHGYARLSDVARELDLTKGSVSVQLKHLKEKGFVTEDVNRFLQLTSLGQGVARDVRYKRELLIQFLQEVLGVDATQAEADACKLEHLLSHEVSRRILALIEFVRNDEETRRGLERFQGFFAALLAQDPHEAQELGSLPGRWPGVGGSSGNGASSADPCI